MKTFRQLSEEIKLSEWYDSDLDANKNGKLDSDDFKRLRNKKKKSDCNENSQLDEAGRYSRYSYAASNMSSHRAGIDVPNVNHKINADGDHEFKGGYQHKIIKQGDTAGLQSHLKHIHDNILGQGNMFVSHSGSKDQKVFNGGKPGVDALHKAVTAHINEGYDIESMLEYIEELESQLDEKIWDADGRSTSELKSQVRGLSNDKLKDWSKNKPSILSSKTKKVQDRIISHEVKKRGL